MNLIEVAKKLRPLIEYAVAGLGEQDASNGVQLFPMDGNIYTPVQAPNAWLLMEVQE